MLINRIKSFAWRLGALVVVSGLSWFVQPEVLQALSDEGVRVPAVVILVSTLVVAEVTKYLNRGASSAS